MIDFEDLFDQIALLVGIEIVIDLTLGDIPVVRNKGPQQSAFWILMIPVKADIFLLLVTEAFVKLTDDRLAGCRGRFGSSGRQS